MKDINVLNINNQQYRIVDPTKIPQPEVAGKVGQILAIGSNTEPVWVDNNSTTGTASYLPVVIYGSPAFNCIKLDITSCPDNYVTHIYGDYNSETDMLPFNTNNGIIQISRSTEDGKTFLTIHIGDIYNKVRVYYIYLGQPYTGVLSYTTSYSPAPADSFYYFGYIGTNVPIQSITQITAKHIEDALDMEYIKTYSEKDGNIQSINAAEGSWVVALVPSIYSVKIYDGLGNYQKFPDITDIDGNVLGCNGNYDLSIDNTKYYIYSKFLYIPETVQIIIPEIAFEGVTNNNSGGGTDIIGATLVDGQLIIS